MWKARLSLRMARHGGIMMADAEPPEWAVRSHPVFLVPRTTEDRYENLRRYLDGFPWITVERVNPGHHAYYCAICDKECTIEQIGRAHV